MSDDAGANTKPNLADRIGEVFRRVRSGDEIARLIVSTAAWGIVLLTVLLVFELWINSSGSRKQFGWGFLYSSSWDPVAEDFGALPFIYGTIVTSVLALLIAVPLGLGCAIFLSELAPRRISNLMTFFIELLAAVPSVIYGLLGIFVVVPLLQTTDMVTGEKHGLIPFLQSLGIGKLPIFSGTFNGVSVFSAGVVLSIMIVPFIVSVSREVLMSVPRDQREGSLALGATRWETTWNVVMPFAKSGILGSIFLALARALGETMAVTMVIGNTPQIKASLLEPGATIASVIANQFNEASGVHGEALIEMGLVLFALTIVINGLARLLILTTAAKSKGGAA